MAGIDLDRSITEVIDRHKARIKRCEDAIKIESEKAEPNQGRIDSFQGEIERRRDELQKIRDYLED